MESSIFRFIRRYSWRQQLLILGLTLLSFPPLYLTLELPKIIINEALGDEIGPWTLFGLEFGRIEYLFVLCGIFLGLVLIGGAIKYVLNVYAGIVAERMLRRLRYQLYEHVLRFPLPYFRRVSQGELVQMINAETEALGGYVGDALAVPAFQGGTLLTILTFMFMQDPILGFAAIALYPVQIYVIPKLQRRVNALGVQRVRQVRRNAERISETASGVRDIRSNDTALYELAKFSKQLGQVFWIRFEIYKKKFLIKFLNNFIAQLGPFFFFSIGGYLVIQGQITLGALVAVVGAHKDLSAPWKELLTYYQTMWDVRIKYEQTVSQFAPAGLLPTELLASDPPAGAAADFATGTLAAVGAGFTDENGEALVEAVTVRLKLPSFVAILGTPGSGREELTAMLAGVLPPTQGRITIDDRNLYELPYAVIGRKIAYLVSPSYLFSGTIAENLLYGLAHRPVAEVAHDDRLRAQHARDLLEAQRSGNCPFDPDADWFDYGQAGIAGIAERLGAMVAALRHAALVDDIYLFGLRGRLDGTSDSGLAERILEARRLMDRRLAENDRLQRLVERFDPERYNENASLAENLLFGIPIGDALDEDRAAANPFALAVLKKVKLDEELRRIGFKTAQTMVELFADLPPEHEYFRQFSFIAPEELPTYRALVTRYDIDRLGEMPEEDRRRLLALSLKLVVARHRLGLIDEPLQRRVVEARREFRAQLPQELADKIAFFEPDKFNVAASIQDNILFGKIAYGQANAQQRIAELVGEIVDELDLREPVIELGLSAQCGVGGGRLTAAQRQKLALARALLRRPDILVLYDPLGPVDAQEQGSIRDAVLEASRGRTVIWAMQQADWARRFDRVLVLDKGRLVADGSYGEIEAAEDGALQRLLMVA
jgi:putative ABC transport system ATP-binding protein